jgi:hypothetical protein
MLRIPKGRNFSILALILLAAPRATIACSVCMGSGDDPATRGLNAAVVTLLAALLIVLTPIAGFMGYLARRAVTNPLTPPEARRGVERDALDP